LLVDIVSLVRKEYRHHCLPSREGIASGSQHMSLQENASGSQRHV
jgi:hypothetical protein